MKTWFLVRWLSLACAASFIELFPLSALSLNAPHPAGSTQNKPSGVHNQPDVADAIPQSPKSYSWQQYRKELLKWCERTMLEPSRKNLAGSAWEADATTFIADAVKVWVDDEDSEISSELLKRGKKLVDAKCEDPLVLSLWAVLAYRAHDNWREVFDAYELAFKKFERETYPGGVAMAMMQPYAAVRKRGYYPIDALDKKITGWVRTALTDGSYTADEAHLFVEQSLGSKNRAHFERNYEQLSGVYENSVLPEWAKDTLIGEVEVERGWEERGGGYADTVTPEGWQGFSEHLAIARDKLTHAWKLRPDRPEAAKKMIDVAMAGEAGGETPRLWFDRAVTAQFDFLPAYNNLLWALRPRWGGSYEEMLAFGRACVATRRYDTRVPLVFIDVLDSIYGETSQWRPLYHDPDIARTVMEMSRDALAAAPAKNRLVRESLHAVYAWLTDDYALAAEQMKKLGNKLDPYAAGRLGRYMVAERWFFDVLAVMNSPGKADFEKAEELRENFRNDDAIAVYKQAAQKAGDRADMAPKRRIAALELELAFSKNEWIKLPTNDLSFWNPSHDDWSVTPDGSLQLKGADKGALIVAPVRIGLDFEMRGKFEIVAPHHRSQTFGTLIGLSEQRPNNWLTCAVFQTGKSYIVGTIWDRYLSGDLADKPILLHSKNNFLIQSWDGKVSYYVNQQPIAENYESRRAPENRSDAEIGFGSFNISRETTTLIRNLEVRRLTSAPAAPEAPPATAARVNASPSPKPSKHAKPEPTVASSAQEDAGDLKWELKILAMIPGEDAIKIQENQIWIEHVSAMKHGFPSMLSVNDKAWRPDWKERISSKFTFDPPLQEFQNAKIKVTKVGRPDMKVEQPSESNNQTLTIDLIDRPAGAGEVELKITW